MDNHDLVKRAIDALNARGVNTYRCSFCGNNSFAIQDAVSTVLLTSEIRTIELKNHLPCLVFICKKCGHLDFFSLLELGVIDKE